MITDTEGIVLKQIKTSYNRRIIVLFTRKFGKISAGTGLGEKGRSKSSLALRPFSFGRYELFKGRDSYNINSATVLKSYYGIGENVDKYMNGSYVLEFTDKVLTEGVATPVLFDLLNDFFGLLEKRERGIGTLVLAYQTKLFGIMGVKPLLDSCTICGSNYSEDKGKPWFSIENGGYVCSVCADEMRKKQDHNSEVNALIYRDDFGIISALKYFTLNPLKKLENIALNEETGRRLQEIIKEYSAFYLDTSNIKSEKLI